MSDETKPAGTTETAAAVAPAPKLALKDRIADLQIGARASAAGGALAGRMKALHAAAPSAAELKEKMKAAGSAVRLDNLNRETLKAGRDGLAAKVEALIKPRAVDGGEARPSAEPIAPSARGEEPKTTGRDVDALKARMAEALKSDPATIPTAGPTPIDMAAVAAAEPATGSASARLKAGLSRLVARKAAAPMPLPAGTADPTTVRTTTTTRTQRTLAAEAEKRRPIFSLAMLATAFTAGGVLHILTTFLIPAFNTGSAYDQLRWQLEPNAVRVFAADANGATPLPFLTADMRYAMCRYDLTNGPVQVSATLADIGWSLALYTPQGDNFYAVPGQDGRVVTSSFTLNTASDRLLLPQPGVRRSDTDAAQVTSPQREGLIVVRAPNAGPAYQPALDEALKRMSCRPAPRR